MYNSNLRVSDEENAFLHAFKIRRVMFVLNADAILVLNSGVYHSILNQAWYEQCGMFVNHAAICDFLPRRKQHTRTAQCTWCMSFQKTQGMAIDR